MDFDAEIARWHRFSDGAIGSTGALLTLFLATTPSDLRERLHDKIMAELQTNKSPIEEPHQLPAG